MKNRTKVKDRMWHEPVPTECGTNKNKQKKMRNKISREDKKKVDEKQKQKAGSMSGGQ